MASRVLPPATQAAGVVAPQREPNIPSGWPGTYVPNFSSWQAGDIVLVHRSADFAGAAIQAAQAASLSPVTRAGSPCSHAAIYVGDGEVVDATVGVGVAIRSVWVYCQTRAIQVRRLAQPSIPAGDVADIAVAARAHIGEPYSVLQVIVSKLFPGTVPAPDALYCSTMVGLVVAEATGVDLSSEPSTSRCIRGRLQRTPSCGTCCSSGGISKRARVHRRPGTVPVLALAFSQKLLLVLLTD